MKTHASSLIQGSLVVGLPLLIASLTFVGMSKRRKNPENQKAKSQKVFGIVYLSIQFYITIGCIIEGYQATGMEDVPVWGMAAFTSWGSGLVFTPVIALIITFIWNVFRKKKTEPNQ